MGRFRAGGSSVGRFCTPLTAMAILEAGNVGRILVGATDHAKEASCGGSTADDYALLVASDHAKFPVLPHRYTADSGFEFLEGRESLAHVKPRVHLRHFGDIRSSTWVVEPHTRAAGRDCDKFHRDWLESAERNKTECDASGPDLSRALSRLEGVNQSIREVWVGNLETGESKVALTAQLPFFFPHF